MASSRLLSSSVSWPSICRRTRRPSACERSRTMRGILEKTFETGCMRAFITLSRRSAVTMSRRRESSVMLGSAAVACSTWLRVSTSSPTRFIIRFSRATSTRSVLSAAPEPDWVRGLPASDAVGAAAAGCSATGPGAGWGPDTALSPGAGAEDWAAGSTTAELGLSAAGAGLRTAHRA